MNFRNEEGCKNLIDAVTLQPQKKKRKKGLGRSLADS